MLNGNMSRRGFIGSATGLGLGTLGFSSVARRARGDQPKEPDVLNIGSRRELFVDDFLVEKLSGETRLQLHHPVPREVVIVHDEAWEGSGSGYHTVIRDGDKFRMFYRGWHLDIVDGKFSTSRHKPYACYAESDDGIHWVKPSLGLIEFEGSKENNIILEGIGTHNFACFKDTNPDAAPEAQFKALAGVKSEGGLFAFQSADGIRWTLMRDEPVITNGAFDSQNLAFWDATRGEYRAYWRTFTAGTTTKENWKPAGFRAIRTGTSGNFLEWGNEADLKYDESPNEHLYTNQVGAYYRAPHIFIGLPTRYVDRGWSESMRALPDLENRELRAAANKRYGTAVTESLLMASHDGVQFKRWNEAFLRPGLGRPGTWQYGQQYTAWHVVETKSSLPGAGPELSLYATEGYWHGDGGKLRRYSLRVDGFVSVNASYKGGTLITKPFTFSGSELSLNFATSAAGSLQVEIQSPDGKAYEGFSLDDCPEHFGDTLDGTVSWTGGSDVSSLAGKPVRLKFQLSDADLYSLHFRDA